MFNPRTQRIALSRDIIWLKKTYAEYVLIKENIRSKNYILQDEDDSYNWANIKIDHVKTKFNTENVKTEENFKTKQDSRGEEDAQKTIKIIYSVKQENQVKQNHHEDIDRNIIRSLKKLDTSYNPASLNYTKDKVKDMMLEYAPQEKSPIHQEHTHL